MKQAKCTLYIRAAGYTRTYYTNPGHCSVWMESYHYPLRVHDSLFLEGPDTSTAFANAPLIVAGDITSSELKKLICKHRRKELAQKRKTS